MAKFDVQVFTSVSPEQVYKVLQWENIFKNDCNGSEFIDLFLHNLPQVVSKTEYWQTYRQYEETEDETILRLAKHLRDKYWGHNQCAADTFLYLDPVNQKIFARMIWDFAVNVPTRGRYKNLGD